MNFSSSPHAGELLVSSEAAGGGFFDQAVIFLLDNDENGAIGVALNKPSTTPVAEVLPAWAGELNPPSVLFAGGPVAPNGAICLAKVMDSGEEPPGWRPVLGDVGLLHLGTPVEIAAGAYSDVRVFAGYSGWDPGQLSDELDRGVWLRAPARDEDVFGAQAEGLWRRVLRRVGGDAGLLSGYADKPALN
ncbi:YqgE/AlgH family protein [Propionibacterium freudenreichii]|uniref:YqgE/AlgH family protein n=1 Tax=Propionibacterium freudenreichii TaxID=1744 RepID=UPI0025519877|nr:YqgE/AlgH family protein [Propionibacterium freudenreichii]MDK9625138.1 YqgE/AlgH family protein [Propionibacterium freudenreichii]MDK9671904.1 YqgE/AlgH family protein [Propionibacterium freudenreichii]MDK9673391.1 YqgE/AlgH family protein [Propionibacterium freudenreichii]